MEDLESPDIPQIPKKPAQARKQTPDRCRTESGIHQAALVEREFLRRDLADLAVAYLFYEALESGAIALDRYRRAIVFNTDMLQIGRDEFRDLRPRTV